MFLFPTAGLMLSHGQPAETRLASPFIHPLRLLITKVSRSTLHPLSDARMYAIKYELTLCNGSGPQF